MARRWPDLATSSTDDGYEIDWTRHIPSGSSVSSVAYEADPTGLTFTNNSVTSNISSVAITAGVREDNYYIKATPTLDSGNATAVSILLNVRKHVVM